MKELLKSTPVGRALRRWNAARRARREFAAWEAEGRPAPPPHLVKQRALLELARRHGAAIFVETGTYYGDMVEAMKAHFDRLVSIELSEELHRKAAARFRGDSRIRILHGDSGRELEAVVATIDRPALFWLDGHYSAGETARGEKETPIFEELAHVLGAPDLGHVIVIDDARLFGVDPAYPSLAEVEAFVRARRPGVTIEVRDDSIRIAPPRATESRTR